MGITLVTGANGQLGNELQTLVARDEIIKDFIFTDVDELDICNPAAVNEFFSKFPIQTCINAAAYTAVDRAESEKSLAFKINTEGAANLAKACHVSGSLLIQVSTDFVFDGYSNSPYKEDKPLDPLNVYGKSKAEGEYRVLSLHDKSIILRTSWLYSSFGQNFVKTMMRLGSERNELKVVEDQKGCPTYARDLAWVILKILAKKSQVKELEYGIFHYANDGITSWYGFAEEIMRLADLSCRVLPIATEAYPTPATRPKYSVLDTSKIKNYLNIDIPFWKDSLKECVNLLKF